MRTQTRAAAVALPILCLGLVLMVEPAPCLAADTAVLTGTVYDSARHPLAEALVSISGDGVGRSTTLTQANGVYRFPGLRPFHEYRLAVEEPGYRPVEYEGMVLEPRRTRVVDFRLKKPGERDVVVLASRDPFPFQELVDAFTARLGMPVRVIDLDAERDPAAMVRSIAAERPDLVVGAGLRAARLIRREVRDSPAILTLIDEIRRYDLESANLCSLANNLTPDELLGKVKSLLPGAKSMAVVYDAESSALLARDLRETAARLRLRVELQPNYGAGRITANLAKLHDLPDVLVVPYDPLTSTPRARERIMSWAARRGVPVVAPGPEWVRRGALLFYGSPEDRLGEDAALIASQILFGTRQPADFSLFSPRHPIVAVNRQTAEALGVTIPPGFGAEESVQ
jgi:putative tryptophan/tyrosine transport system substrate-binding protein